MTARLVDVHQHVVHGLPDIKEDLVDIGIDITVTARDLCYGNRRGSLAILIANYEALGQAIARLTPTGEI
jgi:hypothetical protein